MGLIVDEKRQAGPRPEEPNGLSDLRTLISGNISNFPILSRLQIFTAQSSELLLARSWSSVGNRITIKLDDFVIPTDERQLTREAQFDITEETVNISLFTVRDIENRLGETVELYLNEAGDLQIKFFRDSETKFNGIENQCSLVIYNQGALNFIPHSRNAGFSETNFIQQLEKLAEVAPSLVDLIKTGGRYDSQTTFNNILSAFFTGRDISPENLHEFLVLKTVEAK